MNPEYWWDARGMWEKQLCMNGGTIKGFLVVLRARDPDIANKPSPQIGAPPGNGGLSGIV